MVRRSTELRALLKRGELIVVPGAYDGLSALLVEQAGFPMLHITGGGISAGVFGHPDVGLTTMTEVVAACRRVVAVTSIPAIADADAGFGNALNIARTVREMEAVGVAGIHIEDRVLPLPFASTDGVVLASREEMVKRIEAARESRQDPDFVIVGRTDALLTGDLDEGIARAKLLAAAGADLVYVEGMRTPEVVARVGGEVRAPLFICLEQVAEHLPGLKLSELGYRIGVFSSTLQRVGAKAMQVALDVIRREGTTKSLEPTAISYEARAEVVGEARARGFRERFNRS